MAAHRRDTTYLHFPLGLYYIRIYSMQKVISNLKYQSDINLAHKRSGEMLPANGTVHKMFRFIPLCTYIHHNIHVFKNALMFSAHTHIRYIEYVHTCTYLPVNRKLFLHVLNTIYMRILITNIAVSPQYLRLCFIFIFEKSRVYIIPICINIYFNFKLTLVQQRVIFY